MLVNNHTTTATKIETWRFSTSVAQCRIKRSARGAAASCPTVFWGGMQLVEVGNFCVLYITETCKIWAFAAAEQRQ